MIAGVVPVRGLAGEHLERQIEAPATAPYPLAGDVALNGVWMSDQPWAAPAMGRPAYPERRRRARRSA